MPCWQQFSLYGCGAKTEKVCDHHYYLSGYTAATSSSNGYQEFTCSECGSTYRETIPMDHTAGASSQASEPDLTRKRSVNLFDLPVYSNKNAIDGVLNKFSYASEATDVDGWKHEDCYQICGTDQEAWMRYELNGKYTMARGNLYDLNASGGSGWLEFYDGDDLLVITPRGDRTTTAVDFEIDITDVQFLTVHFCAAESGTWFIADDIILTNE